MIAIHPDVHRRLCRNLPVCARIHDARQASRPTHGLSPSIALHVSPIRAETRRCAFTVSRQSPDWRDGTRTAPIEGQNR